MASAHFAMRDGEHAPATRLVPYRPESGLTTFQKQVLAALDYDRPQRSIDLGLGDARGVGSSIAALIQRGYASGDGKTGYTRNRTIRPRMLEIPISYECLRCGRRFYPFEVSADLRRHEAIDPHNCHGYDVSFRTVDR